MEKVYFKWISRAKFNALTVKRQDTLYFIYNEHVLYKGSQEYGGIQAISYTIDSNDNYVVNITNGDGTVSQLQIASSTKLIQALNALQQDLDIHKATKGDETTSAHVKLTDTINTTTPQDVNANVATTPKAIVDYVNTSSPKQFLQFDKYIDFPIVGKSDTLYLAKDSGLFYTYENGGWIIRGDNWRNIKQINAIIN